MIESNRNIIRWKSAFLGGIAFIAAHSVYVVTWQQWFDPAGAYKAWFLNSPWAVAFTAGCLLLTAAIVGSVGNPDLNESAVRGANVATGAAAMMATVLLLTGPGNLFPIALLIGAVIVLVSSLVGALAGGWIFGSTGARRRPRASSGANG